MSTRILTKAQSFQEIVEKFFPRVPYKELKSSSFWFDVHISSCQGCKINITAEEFNTTRNVFPPERFHVVSTWNTRGVFVRKYLNSLCFYFYKWFQDLVVTFSINCLLWNLLNDCSTESCEKYYLNPRILRPWLSSIILEHKSNQKLSGLEKKKIPISRIFLEHSLLYILIITTISMKINFTWINNVREYIFNLWTCFSLACFLPEDISFYQNIYFTWPYIFFTWILSLKNNYIFRAPSNANDGTFLQQ